MPRALPVTVLLGLSAGAPAQTTFKVIEPAPGVGHTYITHVSGDGMVLAGVTRGATPYHHVLRWTLGGGYQLQTYLGFSFFPYIGDISHDGGVVYGYWFGPQDYHLFRWDQQFEHSALIQYGFLLSSLRITPDLSKVIGGVYLDPVNSDTFIFDGSGVQFPLRPEPPQWPYDRLVYTISADATTGYGWGPPGSVGAFRWDVAENEVVTLGQEFVNFRACSADGAVVVSDSKIWYHRGAAGPFALHPEWELSPDQMSAAGDRLVGAYRAGVSQPWRVFLWEPALGAVDLEEYLVGRGAEVPAGWEFLASTFFERIGISADGLVIAGSGRASPGAPAQGWQALLTPVCYANCDGSTQSPSLNVSDFTCFLRRFAAGDIYANCDQSSAAPYLTTADFSCFLTKFAAGCL